MKKIYLFLLALFLSTSSAFCDVNIPDTINNIRWYKVYWSGIHVADLKAEIKKDGLDAEIKSYGIVKRISKYESTLQTSFGYVEGVFVPYSYYTKFQQRNGKRSIDIKYDADGVVKAESVVPPDNRQKRPAVDEKLKQGALDPLTSFMKARQKVKESLAEGKDSFSFNMYDGRRLAKMDFKIEGRFERWIKNKKRKVIKVTFQRKPIQGFTNNELKRMEGEEPVFIVYLSDDEKLLPLKADADAPLGTAVLLFEKECPSIEECV